MLIAEIEINVLEAQMGKVSAFNNLVDYFQPQLLKYAYQLLQDSAASYDVVQEAWLAIIKRIRKLNDPRAFRAWLYQTVRWKVLDYLKSKNKNLSSAVDLDSYSTESSTLAANDNHLAESPLPQNALETLTESQTVRRLISLLPMIEQEVIVLFYLEEMSIPEISTVLEIPAGTIKSRLKRARDKLRQQLTEHP